jgi:hypothetical protein
MSGDSVRRITEGFGRGVVQRREAEVEMVYDLRQGDESQIAVVEPIEQQGNISTDGVMLLVRGEGWKEVKLTVISQCEVKGLGTEGRVKLSRHSCQAGLWDADTMARYQYVEGLRRGVMACERLSSVNDAALWIRRITQENFPQAVFIVDWPHAQEHLWQVAQSLFAQGAGWGGARGRGPPPPRGCGPALGRSTDRPSLARSRGRSRYGPGELPPA